MKHLFIINPNAGGGKKADQLKKDVDAVFKNRPEEDVEIYYTKAARDATREIRERAQRGDIFRVYACGGDGTLNECANGAACFPNVSLAPYAIGTGNDFCRSFGEQSYFYKDLSAIVDGTVHPIDLIDVNGMYCTDISSVGVDARVGTNVHAYSHLPFVSGSFAYIISTVVEICRGINTWMKIDCGSFHEEGEFALCCVCNFRCYGGGFQPTLTAMPDDGILEIFICKKMNLLKLPLALSKYANGHADDVPQYCTHLRETELTIETKTPTRVNVDGELLITDHVHMKLVPHCCNLIVPKGMTFFD